jgi:hypothetical protein
VAAAEKLGVSWLLGSEHTEADDSSLTVTLALDFEQREAALQVVQYAMEHPLAAVVALDERCAPCRARAASMMGLPANPPKAADACLDKFALRQQLTNVGLRTPVLGDAPAGRDLGVAALMDNGNIRILGAVEQNQPVRDLPKPVLECLPRAARTISLSYGPLWAAFRMVEESPWILDLSPAIPIAEASALQFRIPLVDEDVSLAEVILRHALGIDVARVYRK